MPSISNRPKSLSQLSRSNNFTEKPKESQNLESVDTQDARASTYGLSETFRSQQELISGIRQILQQDQSTKATIVANLKA